MLCALVYFHPKKVRIESFLTFIIRNLLVQTFAFEKKIKQIFTITLTAKLVQKQQKIQMIVYSTYLGYILWGQSLKRKKGSNGVSTEKKILNEVWAKSVIMEKECHS